MEVIFFYLPLKMVKVQKMNVDLNHFNNNNVLMNDWLCILSFVTFIDCWFLNIQQQVCKVYLEPEQVRQYRQSIYNLESGRDGTTRIATL